MERKYFRNQDGSFYTKFTKEEIYSKIDNNNPETFIPFLKEMNYPYIKERWEHCSDKRPKYAFGFYLAVMRLCAYRQFTYEDSIF